MSSPRDITGQIARRVAERPLPTTRPTVANERRLRADPLAVLVFTALVLALIAQLALLTWIA